MIEATTLDLVIHTATVLLAVALLIVSFRAYRKKRNQKFLYILLAFSVFAVKELMTIGNIFYINSNTVTALVHSLNLVIILLFFRGTIE